MEYTEENKELKTIKGFEEENIEVSRFGEWIGKNYIDYKFEYENLQRILSDSIPKEAIREKIEEIKKIIETEQFKVIMGDTTICNRIKHLLTELLGE